MKGMIVLLGIALMLVSGADGHARKRHHHRVLDASGNSASDAPRGCPALYCGCALSIKLFGKIIPPLNASWEWPRRFARDQPAPGNVVFNWRRGGGHVALLQSHVRGSIWLAWDPNTSEGRRRHQTVVKAIDIRGRVVLNPRSSRVALR